MQLAPQGFRCPALQYSVLDLVRSLGGSRSLDYLGNVHDDD